MTLHMNYTWCNNKLFALAFLLLVLNIACSFFFIRINKKIKNEGTCYAMQYIYVTFLEFFYPVKKKKCFRYIGSSTRCIRKFATFPKPPRASRANLAATKTPTASKPSCANRFRAGIHVINGATLLPVTTSAQNENECTSMLTRQKPVRWVPVTLRHIVSQGILLVYSHLRRRRYC